MKLSDEQKDEAVLIENIRTSLRQYPAKKQNIFVKLLICYAITVEIFFHDEFGERYLSWFRCIVGFGFLYLLAHLLPPWDFTSPEAYYYDFPQFFKALHLPPILHIPVPVFTHKEVGGVAVVPYIFTLYVTACSLRLGQIFYYNRIDAPAHPRSSGEPYSFWNDAYIFFHKLKFQTDLVKQVWEPSVCFFLGFVSLGIGYAPHADSRGLIFVGYWLLSGSIALFLKALLENKGKKSLYLDRIGNDMDLDALRMEQQFLQSKETLGGFTEVK